MLPAMENDMRTYQVRQAIAVAAVSVAITVMLLEFYGYIKHPSKGEGEMTSFHSILPIEGGQYRMSPKISPHGMRCKQGFATIFTDDGVRGNIQSLLVDNRERGIRCDQPTSANEE
jgi:hypothetical protein